MRNVPVRLIIFCSLSITLTSCSTSTFHDKQSYSLKGQADFSWPEGKRAAISLSFDDARFSQIDQGLPILNEHNAKATFYVSIRYLEERPDEWRKAVADGHEIGNHSLIHPCSGNFPFARERALEDYTLDRMRDELKEANNIIERLLNVRPVTYAYPCGQKFVGRGRNVKSYVPIVAEEFLAGRGWMDEWANDPKFCDMSQLMGVELDGKDFEQVKKLIDRTLAGGGWLVFCGHEIGEGGCLTTLSSTLRALCEYAQNPANGLWLDTVEKVSRYINEQRTNAG